MKFDLEKRPPALPEVTQAKLDLYFSYLSLKGAKRYAAIMAGLEPSQVARAIRKDEELALRQKEAMEEYKEQIDLEIHRRAIDGVQKPIYFKGKLQGYETQYSDKLLMELAKANNPKYKTQVQVDATVKAGVLVVTKSMDPDDWEKKYADAEVDKSRLDAMDEQPSETEE